MTISLERCSDSQVGESSGSAAHGQIQTVSLCNDLSQFVPSQQCERHDSSPGAFRLPRFLPGQNMREVIAMT
jgi:hypothetical protein